MDTAPPPNVNTKRIRFDEVIDLEMQVPPLNGPDGKRVNKLTQILPARCILDVTLTGVLLTDRFEMRVRGDWRNGYDLIAFGPERPGIGAMVHERSIVAKLPMQPVPEGAIQEGAGDVPPGDDDVEQRNGHRIGEEGSEAPRQGASEKLKDGPRYE